MPDPSSDRRDVPERPSHPAFAGAMLMIGVVVLLIVLAVLSL